jgi:hypothetical protein
VVGVIMRGVRYARSLALAIVVLASTAALALASPRVVVREGLRYKPHEFPISGDGDYLVRGLRWHSWGGETAVASGQAVEQVRPSHVDHIYPVRVTLSQRTFCANLDRTVYDEVVAQILGPSPGVFGGRTLGRVYTCAGTWRLIAPRPGPSATRRPRAAGHRCSTHGMPIAVRSITAKGGAICSGARTVVRDWFHRLKTPGGNHCVVPDGGTNPAVCMVGSWRCTSEHTVDGHTYPVTCTAHRRRVHFVNLV